MRLIRSTVGAPDRLIRSRRSRPGLARAVAALAVPLLGVSVCEPIPPRFDGILAASVVLTQESDDARSVPRLQVDWKRAIATGGIEYVVAVSTTGSADPDNPDHVVRPGIPNGTYRAVIALTEVLGSPLPVDHADLTYSVAVRARLLGDPDTILVSETTLVPSRIAACGCAMDEEVVLPSGATPLITRCQSTHHPAIDSSPVCEWRLQSDMADPAAFGNLFLTGWVHWTPGPSSSFLQYFHGSGPGTAETSRYFLNMLADELGVVSVATNVSGMLQINDPTPEQRRVQLERLISRYDAQMAFFAFVESLESRPAVGDALSAPWGGPITVMGASGGGVEALIAVGADGSLAPGFDIGFGQSPLKDRYAGLISLQPGLRAFSLAEMSILPGDISPEVACLEIYHELDLVHLEDVSRTAEVWDVFGDGGKRYLGAVRGREGGVADAFNHAAFYDPSEPEEGAVAVQLVDERGVLPSVLEAWRLLNEIGLSFVRDLVEAGVPPDSGPLAELSYVDPAHPTPRPGASYDEEGYPVPLVVLESR